MYMQHECITIILNKYIDPIILLKYIIHKGNFQRKKMLAVSEYGF
jgi:hypothetical protein